MEGIDKQFRAIDRIAQAEIMEHSDFDKNRLNARVREKISKIKINKNRINRLLEIPELIQPTNLKISDQCNMCTGPIVPNGIHNTGNAGNQWTITWGCVFCGTQYLRSFSITDLRTKFYDARGQLARQ